MMRKEKFSLLVVLVVMTLLVPFTDSFAADYYQGKTIRIIVGTDPGGGYDRVARLLAKHLPKYIPGKPTILVENMTGGASIIAANHLYNIAKPDGLTIGAPQRGLPYAQLLKADGVRFDIMKFLWIGSAGVEPNIFCVRSELPYKTFDDLRKTKETIHVAAEGTTASNYHFPTLLKEFLGVNIKIVIYPAGAAGTLALERKEVDGRAGSYTQLKPLIDRGLVIPLIRGRVSEPGIENLPVDEDLSTVKIGKMIMSMRSAGDLVGRPFILPPKTPPEITTIIRDAFRKAAKDPELTDEAKKLRTSIEYVPPEECLKVLSSILNQPDEIVKEFSKYINF